MEYRNFSSRENCCYTSRICRGEVLKLDFYCLQVTKLGLYDTLQKLSRSVDINQIDHFSYDQFYITYLKFLQLDENHDKELDMEVGIQKCFNV